MTRDVQTIPAAVEHMHTWLQQATLAIRARVAVDVLRDTIQPFPTFSEIYVAEPKALRATVRPPVGAGRS